MPKILTPFLFAIGTLACRGQSSRAAAPCRIEVVEKGSGWAVPLVELRTTSQVSFITDNAGIIAFDLPECMNRETWFNVSSPGYEVDKDGFGNRGLRFIPQPGGKQRVEVRRTNVARRLGRLTGAGIYGESQKLGECQDWQESGVTGQDTVQVTPYQGKLYWAWGDTNILSYALGLFQTTGATTPLNPLKSFEPPLRLTFDYFRDAKGDLRNTIDLDHQGPIWVGGCLTLLTSSLGTPYEPGKTWRPPISWSERPTGSRSRSPPGRSRGTPGAIAGLPSSGKNPAPPHF